MQHQICKVGTTRAPAKQLRIDNKVGSLEKGKDADFLVLSGDPLDYRTHVLETWVEGAKVFDLSRPKDRLHAMGGYGAGEGQPQVAHMCDDHGDDEVGR